MTTKFWIISLDLLNFFSSTEKKTTKQRTPNCAYAIATLVEHVTLFTSNIYSNWYAIIFVFLWGFRTEIGRATTFQKPFWWIVEFVSVFFFGNSALSLLKYFTFCCCTWYDLILHNVDAKVGSLSSLCVYIFRWIRVVIYFSTRKEKKKRNYIHVSKIWVFCIRNIWCLVSEAGF